MDELPGLAEPTLDPDVAARIAARCHGALAEPAGPLPRAWATVELVLVALTVLLYLAWVVEHVVV